MHDSPRWPRRLAGALAAALVLALPTLAHAQGSTVYQNGTAVPNHIAKFVTNGRIADTGGLAGDASGIGLSPFSITDNKGDGLCINDALTTGAYHKLCFGHDATGTATITIGAMNGAPLTGCVLDLNGVAFPCVPGAGTASGLPFAPDNATLKATATAFSPYIIRADFVAGRGAPAVLYKASNAACSLNAGFGDDGSQVKSLDSKCWIASLEGTMPTPQVWGAVGDGTANDTLPVQAAITARNGAMLYTGPHTYCINAVTGKINIDGNGAAGSGFNACSINQNLFLMGDGARLARISINAVQPGPSTTGYAIRMTGTRALVESVNITAGCVGVEMEGNTNSLSFVHVGSVGPHLGAGCGGVRMGHLTTGGATVDPSITGTLIDVKADWGLRIEDAGGFIVANGDVGTADIGTVILPAASQTVQWGFMSNTALADSGSTAGMTINTAAGTAKILGLKFSGTWTSSTGGAGVSINNAGVGTVDGVHFLGHQSLNNVTAGFDIGPGVVHATLDAVQSCGNSEVADNVGNGVTLRASAAGVSIRGSTIGSSCDQNSPVHQNTGIALQGSNSDVMIVGNDLCGNGLLGVGGALSGTLTGSNIVRDNKCVDDSSAGPIVAADTISIPIGYIAVGIDGATPVKTINGGYNGRLLNILSLTTAVTYNPGGNMCNASSVVVPPGGSAILTYVHPPASCWSIGR